VAGLKYAEIAAKRGHSVEVYEKTDKVGGQVLLAEKMPYRNEMEEIYRYLKIQLGERGVPIHFNAEIDAKKIELSDPEVLVIATGSIPLKPDFPGLDTATMLVTDVTDAMRNTAKIGASVLVYDDIGSWQGGGVADYCQVLGAKLTVVCSSPSIGVDIEGGQAYLWRKRIYEGGADVFTDHVIDSFDGDKVIIRHTLSGRKTVLSGLDTVLVAGQSRSENALYKHFKGRRPHVYSVGDCVAPRGVEQAILEAEVMARQL
jgi:pyruvate/2-oxoglutarate dehydrogenase complex dihydrolipoamide dehydrogenase (E3) component